MQVTQQPRDNLPSPSLLNRCGRRRLPALAATALLALAACGGGGPTAEPAAAPPPAEVAGPDPLWPQQWHLRNTGQGGGLAGSDLGLNDLTALGQGVTVAVVDAAVQVGHPDLAANHLSGLSYNYLNGGSDPSPPPATAGQAFDDSTGAADDAHGTAVAGILAARANNGVGGRGVAPAVRFMAFNPIAQSTDVNLADAMARAWQGGAAVVNNSWGPPDPAGGGSGSYYPSSNLWQQAVQQGVTLGRDGLGTVYLIAAGNGAAEDDEANRDGYANHHQVLAIGAVDDRSRPTSYTEPGANVLVAAPSGNVIGRFQTTAGVVTTDIAGPRGYADAASPLGADHTTFFNGTSASTPMVAGVVALMLEANPRLSWRDVRWLLAATAAPAQLGPGQAAEPSPMNSHGFAPVVGFGRVQAAAAVQAARGFAGLPAARSCSSGPIAVNRDLPDNTTTPQSFTWSSAACGLQTVEFVRVRVVSNHSYSGDLRASLRSPLGRLSALAQPHSCANSFCTPLSGNVGWGSVRHMGEPASGEWTLRLSDEQPEDLGRIFSWEITLYGH